MLIAIRDRRHKYFSQPGSVVARVGGVSDGKRVDIYGSRDDRDQPISYLSVHIAGKDEFLQFSPGGEINMVFYSTGPLPLFNRRFRQNGSRDVLPEEIETFENALGQLTTKPQPGYDSGDSSKRERGS